MPVSSMRPLLIYLPLALATPFALEQDSRRLGENYLTPGLRELQQARDACPLLPEPHLELAAHANRTRPLQERLAYLDRARLLAPADPHLHYYCGLQEWEWSQPRLASADWRRSLELSDEHLKDILDISVKAMSPAEILEHIIPDQPGLLRQAATRLFPEPEGLPLQKPYMEKALRLYGVQEGRLEAEDLHGRALLHLALGQPGAAVKDYRAALDRKPRRMDWRKEFAELLHREKHLSDARRQLLTILEHEPTNTRIQELLNSVTADMARGP
jgi:tetratricopeptide (TPR) repeat protein